MLAYLARYTHRVAISNSRLLALDDAGVTFKWKDYRIKGRDRLKTMTLAASEFIRRFLMHVLPGGFHRIRHYGLFASAARAANIERIRGLLTTPTTASDRAPPNAGREKPKPAFEPRCPCCGGLMIVVETFDGVRPRQAVGGEPLQDRHVMTRAALSQSKRLPPSASDREPDRSAIVFLPSAGAFHAAHWRQITKPVYSGAFTRMA